MKVKTTLDKYLVNFKCLLNALIDELYVCDFKLNIRYDQFYQRCIFQCLCRIEYKQTWARSSLSKYSMVVNLVKGQTPKPYYANFNLKIGSFNMQGQSKKNSLKLRKIKNLMTRGNFDILLLQETRSDGTGIELKRWKKIFNSKQIFLSDFGPNSVGAGIIIGKWRSI